MHPSSRRRTVKRVNFCKNLPCNLKTRRPFLKVPFRHPDRVLNLPEAEQAEASEKYIDLTKAMKV